MKKQWMITCMAALLLSHTSCVKEETIWETSGVESRIQTEEQRVQDLVQQSKHGDTEAYKSLAYCYRDGSGVKKSYMNAIFMYAVYCQETGQTLKPTVELFEEGTPYRLLVEILNSTDLDEETRRKMDQLQQVDPADAKILIPMMNLFNGNYNKNILKILQEAESEGSELASALLVFYYEETKDTTISIQHLIQIAENHPFLFPKIAGIYEERYSINEDFSNIQKAMEYYCKADSHGMLTPKQANHIWSLYDYLSNKKGLLDYNKIEIERFKKIIKPEIGTKNQ